VGTAEVGVHKEQPLVEVDGEGGGLCLGHDLLGLLVQQDEAGEALTGPALLRGGDDDVDVEGLHVGADHTAGDAVEDEDASVGVDGLSDLLDVFIGEIDTVRGVDEGGEDNLGLGGMNLSDDLVDWSREVLSLVIFVGLNDDGGLGSELSVVENLGPAEGEESVTENHNLVGILGGEGDELAGDSFHAVGAGTGNNDEGVSVEGLGHGSVEVVHDALELLGHVVDGAVGVDDGEFAEAVGIGSLFTKEGGTLEAVRRS